MLLTGCSGKKDPTGDGNATDGKKESSRDQGPPKDGKTSDGKPVASMTTAEFVAAYEKNAEEADEKYKGQVVELTGRVLEVFQNSVSPPTLRSEGKPDGVMLFLSLRDLTQWRRALPGQKIKFRGTPGVSKLAPDPPGGTWPPDLEKVEIIEVTGDPPPPVNPDELLKEFAADYDKAYAKVKNRYVFVTGEILAIEGDFTKTVTLKTLIPDAKVKCSISVPIGEYLGDLKPGQKIKACGRVSSFSNKDKVSFEGCILYEPQFSATPRD
jgi:hypothetical protein